MSRDNLDLQKPKLCLESGFMLIDNLELNWSYVSNQVI
jgi:hypothetical protein